MSTKTFRGEAQPRRQQANSSRRSFKAPLVAALGLLAAIATWTKFQHRPAERVGSDGESRKAQPWSWKEIRPSRSLKWIRCYEGVFECARLEVPMDWQDPSEDNWVILGVIKLPAKSQENRFPAVFVNPGGPGGSGVHFVRQAGAEIQAVVGDNQDIISWDPRGVGVSTPRIECWGTSQKRQLWDLQRTGVIDERDGLIYDTYSRSLAYVGACERALNETNILKLVSTPYHARDMLEILDKTGHPKLRYWGLSYGTALGGAFAGLFPDRVERLVSDGNVDYDEYFGQGLRHFLKDADSVLDAFDRACHEAGPDVCAFWGPSAKAIEARRASLLDSLKRQPVLIPAWSRESELEMPERVTYTKVQRLTQVMLYVPSSSFATLAQIYAALEAGDGLPFYEAALALGKQGGGDSRPLCSLVDTPATTPHETPVEPDAFPGIMCADSGGIGSLAEFEAYTAQLRQSSRWMGATHADFVAGCVGRSGKSKWRFTKDDIRADTSFPILYIGNVGDNVTPLESAYNNSASFPSSTVLVQNSYGHCSVAAPSSCTAKHVRAYFQNGTLPALGTQCEQDYGLFGMPGPRDFAALSQADELYKAAYELSHKAGMEMGRGRYALQGLL